MYLTLGMFLGAILIIVLLNVRDYLKKVISNTTDDILVKAVNRMKSEYNYWDFANAVDKANKKIKERDNMITASYCPLKKTKHLIENQKERLRNGNLIGLAEFLKKAGTT